MLQRLLQLLQPAPTKETRLARYSIDKFKAYVAYSSRASSSRIALVFLLTPLVPLVTSLIPPLIRLRDPNEGLKHNWSGFLLHVASTAWLTILGGTLQYRASAGIPHEVFSTWQVASAANVATLALVGFAALVSYSWRFPVPFYWVIVSGPWMICLTCAPIIVSCGRLLRAEETRRKLYAYYLPFTVQIAQIVVYPAFSAAFEAANEWQKIVLTLFFPVLKHFIKQILQVLSQQGDDFAEEARVGGVEICASIYQSMIMQTTPSPIATAVVIGIDFIQGLASIRLIMEKHSVVPQTEIVPSAQQNIDSWDAGDEILSTIGTKRTASRDVVKAINRSIQSFSRVKTTSVSPTMAQIPRRKSSSVKKDAIVMVHALEILQAAENLLLVEYIEVAIPAINGVFLLLAAQMPSAIFNEKLSAFYYHHDQLPPALATLTLYTLLQLVSLLLMMVVMKRRFRLSPATLLAFHLERHAWSLQGKMVAWLAGLLHFSVIHYGADFSFRFHFKVPTAND